MIAFKDLKQSLPVYMLNSETLELTECRVVSNSFPHYDMIAKQNVVDLVIENKGQSATYAMPENSTTSRSGSLIFATGKEGFISEVEAIKADAERIIASVPQKEEMVKKATALMADLNPMYRKEKETEERFSKIEGSVSKMEKMLSEFINEFKK